MKLVQLLTRTYPSFDSDFKKILQQLEDENVFVVCDSRPCFGYNDLPLLSHINWKNIRQWLHHKVTNFNVFYLFV